MTNYMLRHCHACQRKMIEGKDSIFIYVANTRSRKDLYFCTMEHLNAYLDMPENNKSWQK